ncbi:unnamed protein product, partial [Allacma fusca]
KGNRMYRLHKLSKKHRNG